MRSEPMPDAPGPDAPGPEMLSDDPTRDDPYWEHLKKVNDVFYDQIKTADQKAAYLFTFMVAFLLASAEGRDIFSPAVYREASTIQAIVTAVMALAVLVTLFSALGVVLPRKLAKGTSLFWGEWPGQRDRVVFAREQGDETFLFQEYLRNVENLAMLARRKFRLVSIAFRGLMIWLACYILLLAVSPPG